MLIPKITVDLEQFGLSIVWSNIVAEEVNIRGLSLMIGPIHINFCEIRILNEEEGS
jgi:hypothetical protein